jgi:hypothetical protein
MKLELHSFVSVDANFLKNTYTLTKGRCLLNFFFFFAAEDKGSFNKQVFSTFPGF